MTEVTLVNFGDADRGIIDAAGAFHSIKPGKSARLSLDKPTHDILVRAMSRHNDPLVVLSDEQVIPEPVREVLDLMSKAADIPYDALLASAIRIVGADPNRLRPSRLEIIKMLRNTAVRCSRRADIPAMTRDQVSAVAGAVRTAMISETVLAKDKNPPNSGDKDDGPEVEEELSPADQTLRKSIDQSLGIIDEDCLIQESQDSFEQDAPSSAEELPGERPALEAEDPEGLGILPPAESPADPVPPPEFYPGTKRRKRR